LFEDDWVCAWFTGLKTFKTSQEKSMIQTWLGWTDIQILTTLTYKQKYPKWNLKSN